MPSRPGKIRNRVNPFAICGRLFLVLSLWHAPVPVLHAHMLEIGGASGNTALVDHLLSFHQESFLNRDAKDSGTTSDSGIFSEWHFHFVLPVCNGCQDHHHQEHPGSDSPVWKYAVNSVERDLHQFPLELLIHDLVPRFEEASLDNTLHSVDALACEIPLGFMQRAAFQTQLSLQELLSRRVC